jgi:hypothetical protein
MNRSLSTREKTLVTVVAVVLSVFANVALFDWCWKTHNRLRADIAAKSRQLKMVRTLTEDLAFWEQRDAWLQASQPRLTNPDTAGVQLLDHIKQLAKKHNVLLASPAIRVPERQPEYVSFSIEIETKSAWKPLVDFLQELQNPEQFIAVESSNFKIDATDPTQMKSQLRVARWYGPSGHIPSSP